ncbi:MAG: TolC family protein [Salibacteraceae bacterium]|jgi:outer membrane protein|nr:TolC family protein [Salibacteraceae bacterium]MDP4763516.1 TolC family protein [Salibacteraceae bacterium]MDP4965436.1 TolC family protein [Salibacteraceae bacterium]
MKTSTSFLGLILLFAASLGQAQTTQSFSLDEAKAYALKNNQQLKQAALDIEISKAKVRETTAIGLPQISGEASFNHYIDIPTQVALASTFDASAPAGLLIPLQFGLPNSASAGVTASQLVFDGSYFVGLRASKAYLNYSELGQEKSEIDVKANVAQTYFSAVALTETIDALKANKKSIDESYTETKAMFEAGFLEKQDADQVKLAKSNIEYQLDYTERQLQVLKNVLKFQMGVDQTTMIELSSTFDELIASYGSETGLIDQTFNSQNHIDYRTVQQGLDLSELSLDAERTKYMPSLGAFFTHSQNGFSTEFKDILSNDYYPTTIVGLKLNVPIWSSGMRYYKTKQAKLELEKVTSQKVQVEQNLLMQVTQARTSYESAIQNMEVAKENLALAESIKATTDAKYKEGLASSLNYAQSQQQYLQTLAAYVNTANELFNAKLSLEKALGNN